MTDAPTSLIAQVIASDEASEAKPETHTPAPTLFQMIEQMRDQYDAVLPPTLSIGTFMRDARTLIQHSVIDADRRREDGYADQPTLLECAEKSVLGALMTCAQLGLRPGVDGQAHLQPRWSKRYRVHVATFQAGYRGLVKLAYASGSVKLIYAREVYAEDHFHHQYGNGHELVHAPADIDDPGAIRLFYAFAELSNGKTVFERWMDSRMRRHREEYAPTGRSGNGVGPWWNELTYPSMARKTMLRQICSKDIPAGGLFAEAVEADEGVRMDPNVTARPSEVVEHETPGGEDPVTPTSDGGEAQVAQGADVKDHPEAVNRAEGGEPTEGS